MEKPWTSHGKTGFLANCGQLDFVGKAMEKTEKTIEHLTFLCGKSAGNLDFSLVKEKLADFSR